MNAAKSVLLVVVLAAGFIALRFTQSPAPSAPEDAIPVVAVLPPPAFAPPEIAASGEADAAVTVDAPGCLTIRQLEENLLSGPDAARLTAVSVGGLDFEAYRGLDDVSVRAYADQGDAAAMALVGAHAVMRAYGRAPSEALLWLNVENIPDLITPGQTLTPEAGLELNDAAYWFYEAALHGRLQALRHYGLVRSKLFGGPVGLGWISQDEFEVLDDAAKNAFQPGNVYAQAVYDIAPKLQEGALGSYTRFTLSAEGFEDELQAIRQQIAADFGRTLTESGLPPLRIPPTAEPEIEALISTVCESERREMERRNSLLTN